MLNVYANKIAVRVKRLGGGFGGKESRSTLLALSVAFAAHRYQSGSFERNKQCIFLKISLILTVASFGSDLHAHCRSLLNFPFKQCFFLNLNDAA